MSAPTLLTVILNWRTPQMTLKAAEAAAREMAGIDGQIVIVDNDSGDGSFEQMTAAIAETDWAGTPVEVVQSGHNGGFGAGNNFGIRHGLAQRDFDFVYILNSDAFPDAGSLRALMDHLTHTPTCGFAGSYIHGEDGTPHLTAFRFPSIWGALEGAARIGLISRLLHRHIVPLPIPAETTRVDWLAGASMMIRRAVLEEIGLFDERFFLYFEETDLCLRAQRAGWHTDYVRSSAVTHIGSVSTGMKQWRRIPQYWLDSRLYYFRKNHGRLTAALATLAHLVGHLLWQLRRLIGRKPAQDPHLFGWDMTRHYLSVLVQRTPPASPQTPTVPLRKEAKS
ncbi:glycosyltransferase family 2 protein [Shimia sp. R11_0]|uniref:glycosyltransferase family 2 protein n=1 Tax=Shimia sp. R11_0 TaxID=2821096 RepID=UPI001ADB0FA0|nr:glycosyltransferase family 2 protein [Shimia sp. R11_0]MBO9478687.1 glycosyltransferase family 2 protein [Shimia sp. R11_0]